MVLETFLIHELLREDITSAEQSLELHQDSFTSIVPSEETHSGHQGLR